MVADEQGRERRREPRVSARIEVRFKDPVDAAKAFRVYSLNLSAGGLCLRPARKYAVGESLELSLSVPGRDYNLNAVVAWSREGVIGVRFEDVNEDDRVALAELVATLGVARGAG